MCQVVSLFPLIFLSLRGQHTGFSIRGKVFAHNFYIVNKKIPKNLEIFLKLDFKIINNNFNINI